MVDVVRGNFAALLPRIEECIRECDFVAVDTEFTGLHATSEDEVSLFDTMEERYGKLKKFAEKFIICQLGLSMFTNDAHSHYKYVANSFNFYVCPRPRGSVDVRFSFQASNIDFLREHKFDFNKMFHEGLHYLNSHQERQVRAGDESLNEMETDEALGLTQVFKILERAKKPLVGHNMLCDLALICQSFYQPLPDTYEKFKALLHHIFPTIIDTKHLCFTVQKRLSQTKLLEFTSLTDLCGALGSQRGTFYALYSPEVAHGEQCQRYNEQHVFHEAGFDAYCAGFVFLRVAHLLAMKNVKSTEAQAVQLKRYFKLVEPFINRINLIRGPIHFIDLVAGDPPPIRSPWMVVSTPDKSPLTLPMLQEELNCVMDVRQLSPHSALIVVSSRKRAETLLKELDQSKLCIRRYHWTDSPHTARIMGLGTLAVAAVAVATVAVYFCSRTRS